MKTREIAETVGKTERCVQGWAKRTGENISSISAKIASVQKTGISAEYTLDETIAIIETGMGKNASAIYRQNAQAKAAAPQDIPGIIRETVLALVPVLIEAFRIANGGRPAAAPALPAPPLSPRDELRQIVQRAAHDSGDFSGTWGILYTQVYYRLHINIRERAKNSGTQPIDVLEAEGLLPDAVLIARELFGRAA
jgi:hypothetical protein